MAGDMWTVPEVMKYWSINQPELENFVFLDLNGVQSRWTSRDLYVISCRCAWQLRDYGFTEGDVIANGLPNSPERLVTDLAIILAGCVTVNCQVIERDGSDFWNTAGISRCVGVILPAKEDDAVFKLFSTLVPDLQEIKGCVDVMCPRALDLKKLVVVHRDPSDHARSLLISLQSHDKQTYSSNPKLSDLAVLFATSGSSGFCKLVPRTHEDILKAGRSFEAAKSVKYFSDRPFGWMGGFPFDYLAHGSLRILQDRFDNLHASDDLGLWKVIEREQCAGAALLPSNIATLLNAFKDDPPEFKLKFLVTGGQPLRQSVSASIGVLTHVMVVTYASTEASMVCSGVVTDPDAFTDFYSGKPAKNVQLKVVDDENGEPVAPGTQGNIIVKSDLMFQHYYNQSSHPAGELFTADGWFKTGDRGVLDEDGNFYCYCRAGDVVCQGSVIVYCSWPESIICKCPKVVEAAVIRLPGSGPEGALCACVRPQEGSGLDEEELLRLYRESFINTGGFKPHISKVIFLDYLPLFASGKLNKRRLNSIVKESLGIQ